MPTMSELEPGTVFKKVISQGILGSSPLVYVSPFDAGLYLTRLGKKQYANETFYSKPSDEVLVLGKEKLTKLPLPPRDQVFTSCDPEFFMRNKAGELQPGFSVLPPKRAPYRAPNGLIHEDGFQAELSPFCEQCHERVVNRLGHTMFAMAALANGTSKESILNTPYHLFSPGEIQIVPETFVEIPDALMRSATRAQVSLGCDPSLNVYNTPAFTVDNPRDFPFRMAGGHIHLGTSQIAKFLHANSVQIISSMDTFLGVASVALFEGLDDVRRRKFYGRAGEYRKQPHGLEYRTLSSVWTWHPGIAHLVLNLARGSFRFGWFAFAEVAKTIDPQQVRHIIDEHDVPMARAFINKHHSLFAHILRSDSGKGWTETALKLMQAGVATAFPNYKNIYGNWRKLGTSFASESRRVKAVLSEIPLVAAAQPRDARGRFRAA